VLARSETARTAGARQGTAAKEKPEDLKFQRLAANSLDFGQICGTIYRSKKYEKSIDFSAIVL
jgi:hypothetical protein